MLDARVDFLEETVGYAVDFAEHFLAAVFFAQSEFVVDSGHMQCLLEHAQVGQHGDVADAEVGCHHSLVVHADERHEVFHAAYAPSFLLGCLLALEYVG